MRLLAAKRQERRFAEEEIRLLEAFAAHAAVAIDNARSRASLAAANRVLQRTLELDEQVTRAVSEGGDPWSLVERIQPLSSAPIRWVEGDEPGPDPTSVGTGPYARPVVAAGRTVGSLVLDTDTPTPADLLLLERAAPVVALTFVGARAVDEAARLSHDIAVIDLITRAEPDPVTERRRLRGAGLDPRGQLQVLVVDGDTASARRFLGRRLAAYAPAAHRDQLVVLVPAGLDVAEHWQTDGAPTAGLAGPVLPGGLRLAYADASRTARALVAIEQHGRLARPEELGVFAVLLSRTGRREIADQVRRELGPVLAEEGIRAVPLLATLETYLQTGRRATATATALGVHVNTVYQRLKLFDRLLGPAWTARALELQILLRLHRAVTALDGGAT